MRKGGKVQKIGSHIAQGSFPEVGKWMVIACIKTLKTQEIKAACKGTSRREKALLTASRRGRSLKTE